MFSLRFILIAFLLLPFLFSISYSAGEPCCYRPGVDAEIIPNFISDSCPQGQIKVGVVGDDVGSSGNLCQEFEDLRLGCVKGGVCSSIVDTGRIYDIEAVLNLETFENINSFCDDLVPFDASCNGAPLTGSVNEGSGTGSNSGSSGSEGTLGTGEDFDQTFQDTGEASEEAIAFCAGAGAPFGLFATKESCESVSLGDGVSCLYNPDLGGVLRSDLKTNLFPSLFKSESACIPSSEIRQCSDYKTEDNCNLNPSRNLRSTLQGGCTWIEALEYSESFNEKEGMCIGTAVQEDKFLDKQEHLFRGNLVRNPSFEEAGASFWNLGSGASIFTIASSFDNFKHLRLSAGAQASQSIEDVGEEISYTLSFALSANQNQSLAVDITFLDSEGEEISTQTLSPSLSSKISTKAQDIFEFINFGAFVTPEDTESLELSLRNTGSETLNLDALALQGTSPQSPIAIRELYNPLEIIPSDASFCSLCFESLNLNLCTEKKSDFLGDCSYMVSGPQKRYESDLENYLGRAENPFDDEAKKFTSQSLPNANLFCELYVEKETCTDSNNYVNTQFSTLHPSSGATLCKWNEAVGCFKDSNNDNFPDTFQDIPKLRTLQGETLTNYLRLDNYRYERNATSGESSDFALACDSLPPQAYLHFSARNNLKEVVLITQNQKELVGNLQFNMDVSDLLLEACEDFDINSNIYLDYEINNKGDVRTFSSNRVRSTVLADNFFIDSSNTALLQDGENVISLRVFDQSGNLAKEWNFDINLDKSAPLVELVSPELDETNFVTSVLGPEAGLDFSITDFSEIGSCTYELESLTGLSSDFFTPSGSLDLSERNEEGILNFIPPITNTSADSDIFRLTLTCTDIFDQTSQNIFAFRADHRTELVLLEPQSFASHELSSGFLSSSTEARVVSSDDNIESCTLNFDDSFIGSTPSISSSTRPFLVENFGTTNFFTNITFTLNFNLEGLKEGSLTCIDANGNSFTENLVYYFDQTPPQLDSFEYSSEKDINGIQTSLQIADQFFTRTNEEGELKLEIDGTGSWPASQVQIDALDSNNNVLQSLNPNPQVSSELNEESFRGNLSLKNIEFNSLLYRGIPVEGEEGLFELRYLVHFEDKAGNTQNEIISYFFDTITPRVNLGGEVITATASQAFTLKADPLIEIESNAPSYREFTCDIRASKGGVSLRRTEISGEFRLSHLNPLLTLSDAESLRLELDCRDNYGLELERDIILTRDTKAPQLNDIQILEGLEHHFRNLDGVVYEALVSDVSFNLNNTGETALACSFNVTSLDSLNNCQTTNIAASVGPITTALARDTFILNGESSFDNPLCLRTANFENLRRTSSINKEDFTSKLLLKGSCVDGVGLQSEVIEKEINLNYFSESLVDFSVEAREGKAFASVVSAAPFNSLLISLEESGDNALRALTNPTRLDSGLFLYKDTRGFSIESFSDGAHTLFVVPEEDKLTSLQTQLIVDNQIPTLNLSVPGAVSGVIKQEAFILSLSAQDEGQGLQSIELYDNGELIFNASDLDFFVEGRTFPPPSQGLSFSEGDFSFDAELSFRGNFEEVHVFTLKVQDRGGNSVEKSTTISQVEGPFTITLQESENAQLTSSGLSWVSDEPAPILKFITSKTVSFCELKPMIDSEWEEITGNDDASLVALEQRNTNAFSFNLALLSGEESFDLSEKTNKRANMQIICRGLEGEAHEQFTSLQFINTLPDYTLTSSEGFALNEEPFTTEITISSVGVFRPISCGYEIGALSIPFTEEFETQKTLELNLSTLSSGTHSLELRCVDAFGKEGLIKSYEFEVDKVSPLSLEDLRLEKNGEFFLAQAGTIKLDEREDLTLHFRTNKKENLTCTYRLDGGGILSGILNFVRNLFGLGKVEIEPSFEDPYVFTFSGIDIEENTENLRVECNKGEDGAQVDLALVFNQEEASLTSSVSES